MLTQPELDHAACGLRAAHFVADLQVQAVAARRQATRIDDERFDDARRDLRDVERYIEGRWAEGTALVPLTGMAAQRMDG